MASSGHNLIYCDPPWRYDFAKSKSREVENHYSTLDLIGLQEVMADGLEELGLEKDALMFMWATAPKLEWAMKLGLRLGWTYLTMPYVWVKGRGGAGMGHYSRIDHEFVLLWKLGKGLGTPPTDMRCSSVIDRPVGQHSVKPEDLRILLEAQYPDANAVEMFARWSGDDYWTVWGDQAADG